MGSNTISLAREESLVRQVTGRTIKTRNVKITKTENMENLANDLSWEMCKAVQGNNQSEVLRLCLAGENFQGHCSGETIMHWAVTKMSKCDIDLMTYLWNGGAPVSVENYYGATALRMAIRNGKSKLANCLIAMGERLNVCDF